MAIEPVRLRAASAAMLAMLAMLACPTAANATNDSYVVGDRAFAPTALTDDPFVADEAALGLMRSRHGSGPSAQQTEAALALGKRITDRLGIEVEDSYVAVAPEGQPASYGFGNVALSLKGQMFASDAHELLLSAGVGREFGGTGASRIGADRVGSTAAALFFGKGMGDLGDAFGLLKPLAFTGALSYEISDRRGSGRPDIIEVGLAAQYSLRYLEGNVRYLGLPEFIDRMTPLIEIKYVTHLMRSQGNPTEGTIAPGIVYSGNVFDVGIEALLPMTRAAGTGAGFAALFRLRLERWLGGARLR